MATNFDTLSEKIKGINNEHIHEKKRLMMLKGVQILLEENLMILPEITQT